MRRGTNLPAVGSYNQAVLLDLIRRAPDGLSRVELAERSGLSSQTVTNLIRKLLDQGLVIESGKQIAGPGKPRTMLRLRPRGRFAVGVHLDPSVIGYALIDLEGAVVAHSTARTPSAARPDRVIAEMVASIDRLIDEAGIERELILGVGIAAPGPIDRDRGIVDDPPLLEGWDRVPLRDALGERLGMPVALEKDVTAAVIGELWTSDDPARDDFGFFYYGSGVGFGLALDHAAMRGSTANIGDIGHLTVAHTGPLCICGRRGCLGENVSPKTIAAKAAEAGVLDSAPDPADPAAVDAAFTRVMDLASTDERASAIVGETVTEISRAVVTVANLLDLTHIVFGGPFWPRLAAAALERLRA